MKSVNFVKKLSMTKEKKKVVRNFGENRRELFPEFCLKINFPKIFAPPIFLPQIYAPQNLWQVYAGAPNYPSLPNIFLIICLLIQCHFNIVQGWWWWIPLFLRLCFGTEHGRYKGTLSKRLGLLCEAGGQTSSMLKLFYQIYKRWNRVRNSTVERFTWCSSVFLFLVSGID